MADSSALRHFALTLVRTEVTARKLSFESCYDDCRINVADHPDFVEFLKRQNPDWMNIDDPANLPFIKLHEATGKLCVMEGMELYHLVTTYPFYYIHRAEHEIADKILRACQEPRNLAYVSEIAGGIWLDFGSGDGAKLVKQIQLVDAAQERRPELIVLVDLAGESAEKAKQRIHRETTICDPQTGRVLRRGYPLNKILVVEEDFLSETFLDRYILSKGEKITHEMPAAAIEIRKAMGKKAQLVMSCFGGTFQNLRIADEMIPFIRNVRSKLREPEIGRKRDVFCLGVDFSNPAAFRHAYLDNPYMKLWFLCGFYRSHFRLGLKGLDLQNLDFKIRATEEVVDGLSIHKIQGEFASIHGPQKWLPKHEMRMDYATEENPFMFGHVIKSDAIVRMGDDQQTRILTSHGLEPTAWNAYQGDGPSPAHYCIMHLVGRPVRPQPQHA